MLHTGNNARRTRDSSCACQSYRCPRRCLVLCILTRTLAQQSGTQRRVSPPCCPQVEPWDARRSHLGTSLCAVGGLDTQALEAPVFLCGFAGLDGRLQSSIISEAKEKCGPGMTSSTSAPPHRAPTRSSSKTVIAPTPPASYPTCTDSCQCLAIAPTYRNRVADIDQSRLCGRSYQGRERWRS